MFVSPQNVYVQILTSMWWIRRRAFCRWLAQEGRVLMNGSGALIKETWRAPLPLSAIYEPGFRLTDADSADTLILDFLASRTVRKKKKFCCLQNTQTMVFFCYSSLNKDKYDCLCSKWLFYIFSSPLKPLIQRFFFSFIDLASYYCYTH